MAASPESPAPTYEFTGPTGFRMRWKWFLVALAILLAYGMWQCGTALYNGRELSNLAVERFHKKLNSNDYKGICAEADPAFGCQAKEEEITKFLAKVHQKLGDAGTVKLLTINVSAEAGGTFVVVHYDSTFARGPAEETFTWIKKSGALKLYGYHVTSNLFVVD